MPRPDGEGPFSIAASVKLRPDEYMLSSSRAPADDAPRGSRFSSRSVSGRLMMELEGWGGDNLNRALAANQRQERGTLRTHPIRRPREDIFLPKQNALSPLELRFSGVLRWDLGNCRNRGAVLAPAELATINPHPVKNHGQTPGDRDDRSTHPASLGHSHAPCLQHDHFAPRVSSTCAAS